MGAAAAAGADLVVVTDDNPRSEDPAAIAAGIRAGIPAGIRSLVEHERGAAIRLARREVGPAGVVLVAGKGHETEQTFADRVVAWDDRAFVAGLAATEDAA
jgi:UDP-N-acetylmuramoyl-L-alanyl-D-glutamate--2,6-diaminopimelate ligase